MAVRADATRGFIAVMVLLVVAGMCWAGWLHAQTRQHRHATDAAGAELANIARVGGELAGLAAGIRVSDQAAIREFLLFRAGLAGVDVKVEERVDGQRLVRTYAVNLGERARKDVFRYTFNVRSQAPQLSLVEMSQEAIVGKSLRPHDRTPSVPTLHETIRYLKLTMPQRACRGSTRARLSCVPFNNLFRTARQRR